MFSNTRRMFLVGGVALVVAGCGGSNVEAGGALPDFSLLDVNDTSPTAGQQVSPRGLNGGVTAWYFAHAT